MKYIKITVLAYVISISCHIIAMLPASQHAFHALQHSAPALINTLPTLCHTIQKRQMSSKMDNLPYLAVASLIQDRFQHQISPTINIKKMAWPIQQMSPDHIAAIFQAAHQHAHNQGRNKITMPDFYEGIAYISSGRKKDTTLLLPHNKGIMYQSPNPQVASHEAGHLLTELAHPADHLMIRATIDPHERFEGSITRINCFNYGTDIPTEYTLNAMRSRLGGSVAEQIMGLNGPKEMVKDIPGLQQFLLTRTAKNDTQKFLENLSQIRKKEHLSEHETAQIALQTYHDTYQFINAHKKELTIVTDILSKERTIYDDTIYTIFPGTKAPRYCFENKEK